MPQVAGSAPAFHERSSSGHERPRTESTLSRAFVPREARAVATFGLMQTAAGAGVALWAVGAVLLFLVPGGLWSDVPGGALLAIGLVIELLFTAALVVRRLGSRD
jgi:hypothetical protein